MDSDLKVKTMPRISKSPSNADTQPAPGGAAAVDRALSLLAAFKSGDSALGLAELAERTGLYKSTVLRLLASLEHAGLIQKINDGPSRGSYALGMEVARLSGIYRSSFSLERIVMPVLRELVGQTGESAAYHVLQRQWTEVKRLCLYRVDSPNPVRDHIQAGDFLPVDKGAGARILMAFSESLVSSRVPLTSKDRRLFAQIREQGYFASVGDRLAEVGGISAPVFKRNANGESEIAASLTLTMPTHRFVERHVRYVLEAARRLTGLIQ